METNSEFHVGDNDVCTRRLSWTRRSFAPAVVLAFLLSVGTPTVATVGNPDEASGGVDQPDRTADFAGGIAARVRSGDGEPIPGGLFLLLAVPGSDADAQLFDQTPYGLDRDRIHPEAAESNHEAVDAVDFITGTAPQLVDFTSAPGGGHSTGVPYAIAYLNLMSGGAFTGDLVVAATGRLRPHGYVQPISFANEKTAAAHLAGADVLFTPSAPTAEVAEAHGTRIVGELFRARNSGSTLSEERRWNNYDRWGANRPGNGLDVVGIRHVGDIAAYLCGAGSDFACEITHLLQDVVTATSETKTSKTKTSEAASASEPDERTPRNDITNTTRRAS